MRFGNDAWYIGEWSLTLQTPDGPFPEKGYFSAISVREGLENVPINLQRGSNTGLAGPRRQSRATRAIFICRGSRIGPWEPIAGELKQCFWSSVIGIL
jgi:hypothetical protein